MNYFKLFQDEPVGDVALNKLSDELLEKVLTYLPKEELLKCALVSRRFNNIISNSAELMELIPFQWIQKRNNKVQCMFKSKRKHQTICWRCELLSGAFLQFVLNHRDSLKTLKMCVITEGPTHNFHQLVKEIEWCIRKEYLQGFSIEYVDDDMKRIDFKKLETLKIYGCLDGAPWWVTTSIFKKGRLIIGCPKNSKLTKEVFRSPGIYERYISRSTPLCQRFLEAKKMIEEDMRKESFELQALCVNNLRIEQQIIDTYISPACMNMLSILHLGRTTIDKTLMKRILGLNLRLVKLRECELSWDGPLESPNTTIERFLFLKNQGERSNDSILEILECCNNIKYLEFLRTDLSSEIYEKIANMPTLTTLSLGSRRETLKAVSFPFISQLMIDDYGKHKINSIIELIQANKHLKKVTLLECLEQNEELIGALEKSNFFTSFQFIGKKISAIHRFVFLVDGCPRNVLKKNE